MWRNFDTAPGGRSVACMHTMNHSTYPRVSSSMIIDRSTIATNRPEFLWCGKLQPFHSNIQTSINQHYGQKYSV